MLLPRPAVVLAAALACAGCSSDNNLLRDVAVASGITGGEPKPAPDFISRSRSTQVEYIPVGVAPPKRTRVKSVDDVKKAEAELNAARDRNEARGAEARRAGASAPAAAPVAAPPPQ